VDEGRPSTASDTGGPSSRHDEDRPVPHDGDDATQDVAEGHGDDFAHDVAEGHPDAAISD
jgi:hypothetical protein